MDKEPDGKQTSVEPDGVVAQHGEDERDGAELERTVEEEHRAKAEDPPSPLAGRKTVA